MKDQNVYVISGRLTKDLEMAYSKAGTPYLIFSIACNGIKKQDQDQKVSFFECKAWGKTADIMYKYLNKGSHILLQGEVIQDRWNNKEGEGRSKVYLYVQTVQFLGGKGANKKEESGVESMGTRVDPKDVPDIADPDDIPF